jgi:hypothetical protein
MLLSQLPLNIKIIGNSDRFPKYRDPEYDGGQSPDRVLRTGHLIGSDIELTCFIVRISSSIAVG